MNMNKKILLLFIIYIVGIVGFAGYKASKGGETYFSYKSEVKKAKAQLDKESKEDTSKDQKAAENSSNDNDKKGQDANNAAQAANISASQPAANANTQKENDYATVSFSKPLAQNAKGEDVKKLQYLLKKKDCYTGDINGTFDAATKTALIKFQKDNKLTSDGILGSATWIKLEQ